MAINGLPKGRKHIGQGRGLLLVVEPEMLPKLRVAGSSPVAHLGERKSRGKDLEPCRASSGRGFFR